MNYQKQMQKQKRKQMRIQKEKQRRQTGSAYSGNRSGAGWKTLMGIVILAGYLVISFNSPAEAIEHVQNVVNGQ
jgi:hypothetical protein